jgi:hypothetical protein
MDFKGSRLNIFYLHNDPKICAEMHVDKHCVKMILETAQLLSTAHRVLDGIQVTGLSPTGRKRTSYVIPDIGDKKDPRQDILYSATHINHPSAVWCRHSALNYSWLHSLLVRLCEEYTYRYGKIHKCFTIGLVHKLAMPPKNIQHLDFTEPTPAMPDQYKVPGNSVQSYHNYYNGEKQRMFSWKHRSVPEWINTNIS